MGTPKEVLDRLVEEAPDPDTRAKRELIREYLLNADFREKLHDFCWEVSSSGVRP
jgi:hypothetical protein